MNAKFFQVLKIRLQYFPLLCVPYTIATLFNSDTYSATSGSYMSPVRISIGCCFVCDSIGKCCILICTNSEKCSILISNT